MPLIRRVPKRGFNNAAFKKVWGIVNLGDIDSLEKIAAGGTVDESLLRENGLIRGEIYGVKLLGDGELTKALNFVVRQASASAREKVERAGGTITSA